MKTCEYCQENLEGREEVTVHNYKEIIWKEMRANQTMHFDCYIHLVVDKKLFDLKGKGEEQENELD